MWQSECDNIQEESAQREQQRRRPSERVRGAQQSADWTTHLTHDQEYQI